MNLNHFMLLFALYYTLFIHDPIWKLKRLSRPFSSSKTR